MNCLTGSADHVMLALRGHPKEEKSEEDQNEWEEERDISEIADQEIIHENEGISVSGKGEQKNETQNYKSKRENRINCIFLKF